MRVYFNVRIAKMEYKDLKKEIRWFWKPELGGCKKHKKTKENVIALNAGQIKQNKSNFSRACAINVSNIFTEHLIAEKNKEKNKNKVKPRFNG